MYRGFAGVRYPPMTIAAFASRGQLVQPPREVVAHHRIAPCLARKPTFVLGQYEAILDLAMRLCTCSLAHAG